jgi:PAS domain S-box-containing protein
LINRFKTALVLDDNLFKQVTDTIVEGGLEGVLTRFESFDSFKSTISESFSLLIFSFKKLNEPRKVLSYLRNIDPKIPVVFIYPEGEIAISDYKDLIINGASGLVPDTNLKSLIQHIIRFQEPFLSDSDITPFFDELFENYFDKSDTLVSLINSDLKYESVNESFSKFHNLKREELRGMSPSKLWGKEAFVSEIEARLRKSLKGEVIRYKAYFGKGESMGKCYEVVYRPFKPRGIEKPFAIVETRDITDIEESLKLAGEATSRNYYYEKYLPFGIFECNREGDILTANETFYNILEIPQKERESVNLTRYSSSDNRFSDYLKTVHIGESSTFSHIPMSTHNGEEIYTRISSHARSGTSENIIINATLEDNTREVLLEKKLNQTHRIETLGTLAGGIAHDFNTILTTISGYSELSMDELDNNSIVHDYLSKILHSVNRAEDIVTQMLTFSRQIEVEFVPVKIDVVVGEVCNFMQSALPFNILLDTDIETFEGYADADPTQLFRVFLNIITNSMQAMGSKGGNITVKTFRTSDGAKNFANVSIEDTGTGIDKAIIDRIYEPFFSTKDPGEGTGMGLAVAHGIISGMGGEIAVESKPDQGTLFTIRIPIYAQNELVEPDGDRPEAVSVLYADNNIHFSRTVSLALERLGYNVRLASEMSDMKSYLEREDKDDEVIFFRCSFEVDLKEKILRRIVNEKKKARIVLITKPGSTSHRSFLKIDRKRISVLYEPVTLRDIVSSIQNSC